MIEVVCNDRLGTSWMSPMCIVFERLEGFGFFCFWPPVRCVGVPSVDWDGCSSCRIFHFIYAHL